MSNHKDRERRQEKMRQKFNKEVTLKDFVEEMRKNKATEITRILPFWDKGYTVVQYKL